MKLSSKSAIVTGAGSGIGRSIALTFSEHGANVVAADKDLASARETVSLITQSGRRAIAVEADVSKKPQVIGMKESALSKYGAIDVLVNNAGTMSPPCAIEELPEEDWDRVISVNLKGTFLCSQVIGKAMSVRGKGCIINIASTCGHGPYPMGGAYSPSKAAILVLTQQLALEYAKYNIRVNSISPGLIRTPLTERTYADKDVHDKRITLIPVHRIGGAEDIANVALFLASDDSSYVNATDILVDGGFLKVLQQLLPGRSGIK
jgi:NAD(P)-dependent dehydrogenase (short-subunit alcohol dehydrogenase family)